MAWFDTHDQTILVGLGPNHDTVARHHDMLQIRGKILEQSTCGALVITIAGFDDCFQPVHAEHSTGNAIVVDVQHHLESGLFIPNDLTDNGPSACQIAFAGNSFAVHD